MQYSRSYYLEFRGSAISDDNRAKLRKAFSQNDTIMYFNFHNSRLTDAAVDPICRFLKENKTIKALRFNWSTFTDAGLSAMLLALEQNELLTVLSLWRSELTDEVIDSLCAVITQNDTIKVLDLCETNLPHGQLAEVLAALCDNTSLSCLKIGSSYRTYVDKNFCVSLTDFLIENDTMKSLTFQNILHGDFDEDPSVHVMSDVLHALCDNTTISTINFENHEFTDAAIEPLCAFIRENNSVSNLNSPKDGLTDSDLTKYLQDLVMTVHRSTIDSFEEQIEDIITCDVCMERMKDPKVLLCQHTFCQSCVERLAQMNRGNGLSCPTCRKMTPVPSGGVGNLPSDYKVKNLSGLNMAGIQTLKVEMERLSMCAEPYTDRTHNVCKICKRRARHYCTTCSGYLCKRCSEKHIQKSVFKEHNVVSVRGSDWETATCQKHPGDLRAYFCKQCGLLECSFCVTEDHADCDVVKASEYVNICHREIQTCCTQLEEAYRQARLREMKSVATVRVNFGKTVSEITEQITRSANERIRKIEEEKEILLSSLEENKVQLEKKIEEGRNLSRSKVEEMQSKCDQFLATTTAMDVFSNFEKLSLDIVTTISTFESPAYPSTTYSVPTKFVEDPMGISIGSITRETVDLLPDPSTQLQP